MLNNKLICALCPHFRAIIRRLTASRQCHTTALSSSQSRCPSNDVASTIGSAAAGPTTAGFIGAEPSHFCEAKDPIPDFKNVHAQMHSPDIFRAPADIKYQKLLPLLGGCSTCFKAPFVRAIHAKLSLSVEGVMDAGIIHYFIKSEPFADSYFFV